MVQTSQQFENLVDFDPVLEEIFFQQYEQVPDVLTGIVLGFRTSNKAKETNTRIGSFSDPTEFNGQIDYDTAEKDYDITFRHTHLTKGFKVERTALEDMQYSGVFDSASNLGQTFARKQRKDAASIFNNAFSSSVLGYDGKPLCATDHPRSMTDSTNVSNYLGAKALTDANLEEAVVKLESLGDDRGNETNAMATVLLGGRNNRKKIRQMTGSQLDPESGNNAINIYAEDLIGVVCPFITGNKWFVLDGPMALMTIKWFERLAPQFGSDDDVAKTMVRSYFGRMRYSFGWTDFRAVVGSNPA